MDEPEVFVVRIYRRGPGAVAGLAEPAGGGSPAPFNSVAALLGILGLGMPSPSASPPPGDAPD